MDGRADTLPFRAFLFGGRMETRDYPIYGIYVSGTRIPRKKHDTLGDAITEATRLSAHHDLTAFVIEYDKSPFVICRCTSDGKIEQM